MGYYWLIMAELKLALRSRCCRAIWSAICLCYSAILSIVSFCSWKKLLIPAPSYC